MMGCCAAPSGPIWGGGDAFRFRRFHLRLFTFIPVGDSEAASGRAVQITQRGNFCAWRVDSGAWIVKICDERRTVIGFWRARAAKARDKRNAAGRYGPSSSNLLHDLLELRRAAGDKHQIASVEDLR